MSHRIACAVASGLILLTAAPPAFAQVSRSQEIEQRRTSEYGLCIQRDSSTAGMRECASAEFRRQDRELNTQYQRTLRRLNARQQARLRAAQRAWVAWRQAGCAAMADEDWGSLSLVTASECMVDMTIARTINLEEYPRN